MSRRTTDRRTNRTSRLERRDEREARGPSGTSTAPRARRQRQQTPSTGGGGGRFSTTILLAIGGGVAFVAFLLYAVLQAGNTGDAVPDWRQAELNDAPAIPGTYIPPHPGLDGVPGTQDRPHVPTGTVIPICTDEQLAAENYHDPLCYHSNPPTSGPHSPTPQGFTNLENPAPKENIVHSMEHGGVFIWYNTDDEAAIELIHNVVDDNTARRRFVGSTIYTEMEPDTIAITSWTRLDKFPVTELTRERLQSFINENHKRFNPEGF